MVGIAWERDRVVRVVETAAVLALCALAVAGNLASVEGLWRRILGVALGAAMTVPLLARRRAPLAVATAVVGATWLQFVLLGPSVGALGSWIAYLVATYSVGAHAATWRAVVGLAGVNGPGGCARDCSVAGRRRCLRDCAACRGVDRCLGGGSDLGATPSPGRAGRAPRRAGGVRG